MPRDALRYFLQRLTSFCRLICFDKRGTGLSDRVTAISSLEERMDDVRAVMDAADSQRAALLGISEGGPMCALFAATDLQRTSALIMYGAMARIAWAPDQPWGRKPEDHEARLQLGGIAVHIGARVAALAAPDEVLVSSTVRDLVAGSGLRFHDRGIHSLRGVPGEWRLFAVKRLER